MLSTLIVIHFFFYDRDKANASNSGCNKKIRDATYSCKNNNKIGISGRKEKERERKDPHNQCPFRVDETRFHQHMQSQPIEWHTWHPHITGEKKKLFLLDTSKRDFRIMKDAFSLQPRDGCPLHPASYWWWSWSYERVKKKKGSGKEVLFFWSSFENVTYLTKVPERNETGLRKSRTKRHDPAWSTSTTKKKTRMSKQKQDIEIKIREPLFQVRFFI